MRWLERLGRWGLLMAPGALLVLLGFNAGGFFPGAPALVCVLLLLVAIARVVAVPRPFAGLGPALAVAAGALGLYAAWTLLSAAWSDSSWRALVEFDRALLYLVALILFGSLPRDPRLIGWMMRGLAVAIGVVCSIALVTRLAPDLWPIAANLSTNRLSYPITYWNALGLLASIGTILCLHLTSAPSEPRAIRVLGAGAIPILATTLFLTFSRGAILAGAIGLAAYIALGRPRALFSGLLAAVPTSAVALVFAYEADKLASLNPTSSAASAQGHHLALALGLCVAAALGLRWLLLRIDPRLERLRLPDRARRWALGSLAAGAVVAIVILIAAFQLPGFVLDQYHRFLVGSSVERADPRTRLTDPGNNGRLDQWRVALDDGFERSELHGQGAGTYELIWARYRPASAAFTAHDAHSLYVENLSDLGLVGLICVLVFVLAILAGFARGLRGADRALYAALLAAGLAWALHAGIDWDWEMPAVTLWFFALGGAALAAPAGEARLERSPPLALRALVGAGLAAICIVPALVAISQGRLDRAFGAFEGGADCRRVIELSRGATSVLSLRPEPYQLRGYCQARLGESEQAVESMSEAIDRDPANWQYRYSLAVAQAAAGIDPRPAARAALRLDPLEPLTAELVRRMRGSDPAAWRRRAGPLLEAPLL
jgi:tetratricopeptide (TPR) repeat protein